MRDCTMTFLSLTNPIYKTTRNRKTLLGWNQVLAMHRFTKNSLKRWYDTVVLSQLSGKKIEEYDGKYGIEITLYYENARCDLGNVCGIAEKFTLDALQECGALKNDNVVRCVETKYLVGGCDKENPRVEVNIYKIK